MADKIKYNFKDPKYFDVKHLAKFLSRECAGKDVKIKFENGKNGGKGSIKIMGNPAKISGALPDGWSYDPGTNRFRNGNKAEAEYIDIKPLRPAKPLKNIVDMSDVMYTIKCKRPDIKLKALDTTTFGVDGATIANIDWKGIFGSKFRFDKATGTIQGETAEGVKLAFNVLGEKFENRKFETVSETKYTSNVDGIMMSGFSEGNRQSVEHTADFLLKSISNMDSDKLIFNADMEAFDVSEARFLFNTCNLVPDPRGEGLAIQNRETGVISSDPVDIARLAIVYTLTELVDGQTTTENNPLLDNVTRGEVNWENFDEMFNAFADNPEVLSVAIDKISDGMIQGDRPMESRQEVVEAVEEVLIESKDNSSELESPKSDDAQKEDGEMSDKDETEQVDSGSEENGVEVDLGGGTVISVPSETSVETKVVLKNDGGVVDHLNIGDDKNPMSYEQLMSMGQRYDLLMDDGVVKGVYLKDSGEIVNTDYVNLMTSWLLVKDALQMPNAQEYWNNVISKGDWQEIAHNLTNSALNQKSNEVEAENDNVMEMKHNGDNTNS